MKKFKILCCIAVLALISCGKKDDEVKEEVENSCGKTLSQIVPQQYLEDVKKQGFMIHTGTTPPDISGTYRFAPWKNETNGQVNETGFTSTFGNQTTASIDVSYTGYYAGFENCKPFIMGSGNNFTVCRYIGMDACAANFRYNYMQLISGTKEGNVLRNIKIATIGLDAVSSQATCVEMGKITIYSDADGVSNRP